MNSPNGTQLFSPAGLLHQALNPLEGTLVAHAVVQTLHQQGESERSLTWGALMHKL